MCVIPFNSEDEKKHQGHYYSLCNNHEIFNHRKIPQLNLSCVRGSIRRTS